MRELAAGAVRFLGVELGGDGAAEWLDRRRVVFVPREAIVNIEIRRGIAGERPILQVLFGVATMLLGAWVLLFSFASILDVVWRGGAIRVFPRLAAAGVPVMILGAWVLWTGLRPTYYLRVRTASEARKLLLARKIDLAELSRALHDASQRFGYAVTWGIEDPRPPVAPFR
jgi:hypothetical protein